MWIWPEPLYVDGVEDPILLCDSQGTFGSNMDRESSTKIFGISALTSSLMIFNVSGEINEQDLANLDVFAQIALKASNENNIKALLLPRLLFIVRDWKFSDFELGLNGGKKYLREKFYLERITPEGLQIRERIINMFGQIDCCLLPHPGSKVDTGTFKTIRDFDFNFLNEVTKLVKSIFSPSFLSPKTLNSQLLNAQEVFMYFNSIVKSFNNCDELGIKSIYEASVFLAFHDSIKYFETRLKTYWEQNKTKGLKELDTFAQNLLNETVKYFDENSKLLCKPSQEFREVFLKSLKEVYSMFESNAKKEAEMVLAIVLKDCIQFYQDNIQRYWETNRNAGLAALHKNNEIIKKQTWIHFNEHPKLIEKPQTAISELENKIEESFKLRENIVKHDEETKKIQIKIEQLENKNLNLRETIAKYDEETRRIQMKVEQLEKKNLNLRGNIANHDEETRRIQMKVEQLEKKNQIQSQANENLASDSARFKRLLDDKNREMNEMLNTIEERQEKMKQFYEEKAEETQRSLEKQFEEKLRLAEENAQNKGPAGPENDPVKQPFLTFCLSALVSIGTFFLTRR
ncbi:Atlastin-1-like protein [Dinothrombium tinctorium]|uniref:Atlastin-1-like protein n=1 Tax=Dinothrombium tinctorium TaxID=1965070 RepID=A0A443Q9F5_9ACAR|nr:Atlastin-1-like protein [Dinothrombium tinctorium]